MFDRYCVCLSFLDLFLQPTDHLMEHLVDLEFSSRFVLQEVSFRFLLRRVISFKGILRSNLFVKSDNLVKRRRSHIIVVTNSIAVVLEQRAILVGRRHQIEVTMMLLCLYITF